MIIFIRCNKTHLLPTLSFEFFFPQKVTLAFTKQNRSTKQNNETDQQNRWGKNMLRQQINKTQKERWGAGVETQKNVRGEIGGWGRVPFNEPYAPSLSTIYDGA